MSLTTTTRTVTFTDGRSLTFPVPAPRTPDRGWLAPDSGYVSMPCCDTVEDTVDAVELHRRECATCLLLGED